MNAATTNYSESQKENDFKLQSGRKFSLYLLIVASIMLFAGLTSAFIVRRLEGNWFIFEIPQLFLVSTGIAILGSIFMIWALGSAKKDNIKNTQIGLALSLTSGITFLVIQILGFSELIGQGLYFSDSGTKISVSFFYALVAVHYLHILGGTIYLLVVFIKSLRLKVHKKNILSLQMCSTYWHFVGIIWIYLYLFLNFYSQ